MLMKLTTSTDTERCCIEEMEEEKALLLRRPWSDLPPDLLELIASSGLTRYDRRQASRVCKAWHSVLRWVKGFPWTFYYPRRGEGEGDTHPDTFKLSDPTMPAITYSIHMSEELSGATPCFAKDGWLLLYRRRAGGVFFFNPFTRHSIQLPDSQGGWEEGVFAFSCAPTSPGCVVFVATRIDGDTSSIGIHTCHPGATQWTTSIHSGRFYFPPARQLKLVVCNGLFYCLCFLGGGVGIFDPRGREWTALDVTTPAYRGREKERKFTCCCNRTFVAEYGGEILGVHTCQGEKARLFKLLLNQRREEVEWKEVSSLNGASFFAGIVASHATNRIDLPPRIIRNRIYLPHTHFAGKQKRCTSYSIDDVRGHRTEVFDESWKHSHLLNNIFWIEPPQILPSFFSYRLADQSRKKAGDEIECLPPY